MFNRTDGPLSAADTAQSLWTSFVLALYPARCGICSIPMVSRTPHRLCDVCFEILLPNIGQRCDRCDVPCVAARCRRCSLTPPSYQRLRAPFIYGGGLAQLIVKSKFQRRDDLAVALGHLLVDDSEARQLAAGAACIVPVPLAARRLRQRGYNQSALLGGVLAKAWDLPLQHALLRKRHTAAQSGLPLAERRQNVRQAFAPRLALSGSVLLVDDVVTSGETVHHATQALLQAGAQQVAVIAVARASDELLE